MLKKDPGAMFLETWLAVPEASEAVGSVHATSVPGSPSSMVCWMLLRQAINGATVSTVRRK